MTLPNRVVTLLLIDDDPSIVRLLHKVIKRHFNQLIKVESFTDSSVAHSRIDQGGVDIVLTDLEMPGIDGLELLRFSKQRNAFVQVLFLTGHSSQEALLNAFEFGATDYMLKPVDQERLLELISLAYSRQQRWQQALGETWQQRRKVVTECDSR